MLHNSIAAPFEPDYGTDEIKRYIKTVVRLPMGHHPLFLDQSYVREYVTNITKGDCTKHRQYKRKFGLQCNPSVRFDKVLFPKCMADRDKITLDDPDKAVGVPPIHAQITGVKAEVKRDKKGKKSSTFNMKDCTLR